MAKASHYYYDQLNKEQQKAYYAMKTGLLNLQDSFAVPMVSKKELSDIYFMLSYGLPGDILFGDIFLQVLCGFYSSGNDTKVSVFKG